MALKVVCNEPVPISPDNCDSTPGSDDAGRLRSVESPAGSEPPVLAARSIADARFFWLVLSPAVCSNSSDSDSETLLGE
ncbi:hypothetical protein [Bradyrhizobium sp.]|jgi:hypothetical protein|uniref:hypothetical protein n=1 Tax=Bradyrhizobium sp. TaxID=376 RepID=UPI003D11773E